ncbi:hypothetical protein C2E23DRAFT_901090 [Lenzites betulinus]|nr:hypothetical protein C2E23DRAFT_901090 [Lenzites betulinus]
MLSPGRWYTPLPYEISNLLENLADTGTFSSSPTYRDVPNPILELQDFGTIAVPINRRTAGALREYGELDKNTEHPGQGGPLMARGMQLISTILGYREIEKSKVVLHNTRWAAFIEKACQEAKTTLGIQVDIGHSMSWIVIQEPGRCTQYRLTPDSGPKGHHLVAKLAVFMPSQYAGGAVDISHEAGTTRYIPQGVDTLAATCVAWRTDATFKLQPIARGARIVYFYDITIDAPAAEDTLLLVDGEGLRHLRRCFSSWERKEDKGLSRIVHILKDKHPRVNLRKDVLRGDDARLVSLVEEYAVPRGLRVALASITLYQSDLAYEKLERHDRTQRYGRIEWDHNSDDSEMYWAFMENLVTLHGDLLFGTVSFKDEYWCKRMSALYLMENERLEHDEEEVDHLFFDGLVRIERAFHRTALVIWPSWGAYHEVPEGKDKDKGDKQEQPIPGITHSRSQSPLPLSSDALRPGITVTSKTSSESGSERSHSVGTEDEDM